MTFSIRGCPACFFRASKFGSEVVFFSERIAGGSSALVLATGVLALAEILS